LISISARVSLSYCLIVALTQLYRELELSISIEEPGDFIPFG
jgi:hypothetical protein